ncbi:hypothetical protein L226DRAFT_532298 [Lentinus tigrinus ALCF2SS1-7]|nr:hypothetical protein L226DRAFT_532298 [Lentinus tigrinus ALCF2SS1-7]
MAEYGNVHFISHGQNRGIWLHVHATVFVNSDFSHLVAHVDTRDITTFRLSILPNAVGCLSFLRSMLVKMPSLSRLLVKCEQRLTPLSGQALLKEVAEALTPSSSSSNDGSPAEIPAPGLNSLGIEIGLIQDYRCHPGLAGAAINRQKVPLDAVVRMAASRKRSAHPIRSLVCNISGCTREDLLPLSKFVSEFDVATGPLFVAGRYVPSAFKMKNDYWELFRSDDGMTSWDMPEESY